VGPLEAFHSFATLAFVAGSAVVSARLLWLAARERDLPALLLGGAIGCTAVLGYGVLIGALIVRGGMEMRPDAPALAVWLTGFGRVIHAFGVSLHLIFVLRVFRSGVGWARTLAAFGICLIWVGVVAGGLRGAFREDQHGTWPWICEYAVIWTYMLWSLVESFSYAAKLRRRLALGLGSAIVANRFWLWGTGSLCGVMATWIASVPYLYVADPDALAAVTPAVRVATALTGLASVSCSLFAFLPPRWYRRWIASRAPAPVTA
jgi:hypothetical protein